METPSCCFTDCPLQARQLTQQAVGSGSGTGRTGRPWGRRALRSSKGKGSVVLSSRQEQGELSPPTAPLSFPPPQEWLAAAEGAGSSPSQAGVGGR